MPSKNIIKTYVENGCYHIYNRGVEKRKIFIDDQDYKVFLSYLKLYLSPKDRSIDEINNKDSKTENKEKIISEIYTLNNFFGKIDLISFVLMPNHFHLQLKQKNKKEIEFFMRSLITKYSKYFNRKYDRVGPLFQGRYKAVLIQSTDYLLFLSRYIHLNPKELFEEEQSLESYPWSSYPSYVKNITIGWLNKKFISTSFVKISLYKKFVEDSSNQTEIDVKTYKGLLLD